MEKIDSLPVRFTFSFDEDKSNPPVMRTIGEQVIFPTDFGDVIARITGVRDWTGSWGSEWRYDCRIERMA